MKWPGVFLLPSFKFAGTIYASGWRDHRGTVRVKCLAQEHNSVPGQCSTHNASARSGFVPATRTMSYKSSYSEPGTLQTDTPNLQTKINDVFFVTNIAHFQVRHFLCLSYPQYKAKALTNNSPQLSNYFLSCLPGFRGLKKYCLNIWVVKL